MEYWCFREKRVGLLWIIGGHYIYNIGIDNVKNAEELVAAIIKGTDGGNPDGHFTKLTADPANPGKLIVYDDRASSGDPIAQGTSGKWKGWIILILISKKITIRTMGNLDRAMQ